MPAENRNFENNFALLREARKSRDIDRKVAGAWLTTLDVDFDCETIRGTGTATVQKGAGPGEYRSTENMHYRRTLKPGCKAIPGYRREFDDQSETVWVVGQNTITVIDDPSYPGAGFWHT